MRLLSPEFVGRYRGRILNIHPALLPKFPGLDAQRRALEAGEAESGCTVHLVDEGTDSGPILLQRRVPILQGDTEETLSARILAEEHRAYPEAIARFLSDARKTGLKLHRSLCTRDAQKRPDLHWAFRISSKSLDSAVGGALYSRSPQGLVLSKGPSVGVSRRVPSGDGRLENRWRSPPSFAKLEGPSQDGCF